MQVHIYCKQLSQPILAHTLQPRVVSPSPCFTLATVWKPNSTHLLASASTGSIHILAMNDSADAADP